MTFASSAKAALGAMEKGSFNLAFTDLQIPEMPGVELTSIILGPGRGEATEPLVLGLAAEVSELIGGCKVQISRHDRRASQANCGCTLAPLF